jgi:hypothetical protein
VSLGYSGYWALYDRANKKLAVPMATQKAVGASLVAVGTGLSTEKIHERGKAPMPALMLHQLLNAGMPPIEKCMVLTTPLTTL